MMKLMIKKSKIISVAAVIILTLLSTFLLQTFGFFDRIESASFDHRVGLYRSETKLHPDVVVVLIDEESLQYMDDIVGRWPWPRATYRELLDFFALADAQAFALDILFVEQQDADADNENDRILIEATRQAGNAVHAMQLLHTELPDKKQPLPEDFARKYALESSNFDGPVYDDYLLPIKALYQASRDVGYLEIVPDRDGVYRRTRLFNRYADGSILPSLASALVLPVFNNGDSIEYTADYARIGTLEVPLDGDGNFLINPYGKLNVYSAAQVIQTMSQIRAGETENLILDPGFFNGKMVLLGASAVGLKDVKATALTSAEAGIFLHAYTVSNLLQEDFLIQQSLSVTLVIILLVCCISGLPIILISRLMYAALFPVSVAIVYLILAYAAFSFNYVAPVIPVLYAIFMSLLLAYSLRTYQEKHSKQKIRKMLGQYVSPAVLTSVIDSQEDLRAEVGSTELLSILFSDIRGFTNISEELEANRIVELLNIYFSDMTEVIFDHDGTLDKFIGDAIMAFWGAPIKIEDHAEQAVASAIDMYYRLQQTNAVLEEKSYPRIDIGIGIHTGEVVLGNIGSEKKLDYTVIGDSVNLASRLEGLTKVYGCPLIISEDTWQSVRLKIPCIPLDRVRVKGKQQPIGLFVPAELFREANNLTIAVDELQQRVCEAFDLYLQRNWQAAANIYGQIGECVLLNLFRERCELYHTNEPDKEWNGVFTFSTK